MTHRRRARAASSAPDPTVSVKTARCGRGRRVPLCCWAITGRSDGRAAWPGPRARSSRPSTDRRRKGATCCSTAARHDRRASLAGSLRSTARSRPTRSSPVDACRRSPKHRRQRLAVTKPGSVQSAFAEHVADWLAQLPAATAAPPTASARTSARPSPASTGNGFAATTGPTRRRRIDQVESRAARPTVPGAPTSVRRAELRRGTAFRSCDGPRERRGSHPSSHDNVRRARRRRSRARRCSDSGERFHGHRPERRAHAERRQGDANGSLNVLHHAHGRAARPARSGDGATRARTLPGSCSLDPGTAARRLRREVELPHRRRSRRTAP